MDGAHVSHEQSNFRCPLPHVAGSPGLEVLSGSLTSVRPSDLSRLCSLFRPYKPGLSLTDLPCSHVIPRLHADGTNPGSNSVHSPYRMLSFCLPRYGIGSATSITIDFGVMFAVYYCFGLQPPCLSFAMAAAGHHARLGSRLRARLCRGLHFRKLNSMSFQGTTRTDPYVRVYACGSYHGSMAAKLLAAHRPSPGTCSSVFPGNQSHPLLESQSMCDSS